MDIGDFREIIHELGLSIHREYSNDYILLDKCPFCHNGKSNRKRAFFLFGHDRGVNFFCHNGDCVGSLPLISSSGDSVCKMLNREDIAHKIKVKYLQEIMDEDISNEEFVPNYELTSLDMNTIQIGFEYVNGVKRERYVKNFPIDEQVSQYLDRRCIPTQKRHYFTKTDKGFGIKYLDSEGNLYNFQERSSTGYFFAKQVDNKFALTNVFNLFNVKPSMPIVATEGVIDSLFINNAISIGGSTKWKTLYGIKDFLHIDFIYFLQDNDEAGYKCAFQLLQNGGVGIFNWNKFLQDYNITEEIKDINDLYTKGVISGQLSFMQLRDYFTKSKLELQS